ncbi:thermonuclease family protein [Marinomonas sp. 15G1-11]|uniref:Thermonuclease family protein n=1 Tax=Marinomonas phaeophyticola TaxID=3004091 RepID=A0ABT4JTN3_9GAMM|nr:thermonuclease family protein [Marinomonas sp. 15G1-11]MCZ2721606.1 thermonuclease family protein [Marinomonas sp. 15G1-11]
MLNHATRRLFCTFLLILPLSIFAQDIIVSRVVSVYDADTFRVDIEGWPDIVGKNMPIRVLGVDAPEIRGKCESEKVQAKIARDFTRSLLESGARVELRNLKRGKYFRFLADVYIDETLLSEKLIIGGLARPYDGGHRGGWCE